MEVRMDLAQIVIADTRESQLIVLRERDGLRVLPIMIGHTEASAIDRGVKDERTHRPLTHDLLANLIEALSGTLEKVVINDLQEHTFYAKLVVRHFDELIELDSRPSDAVALAVTNDVPIYVEDHVLRDITE